MEQLLFAGVVLALVIVASGVLDPLLDHRRTRTESRRADFEQELAAIEHFER